MGFNHFLRERHGERTGRQSSPSRSSGALARPQISPANDVTCPDLSLHRPAKLDEIFRRTYAASVYIRVDETGQPGILSKMQAFRNLAKLRPVVVAGAALNSSHFFVPKKVVSKVEFSLSSRCYREKDHAQTLTSWRVTMMCTEFSCS